MTEERFDQTGRYEALMDVVRSRMTNRAFAPYQVPREHFELILEAARHAPSGANAQPWHYVVVTDPAVKETLGSCFVEEQQRRARLKMGFPTPNYNEVRTAPGLVVVVADFRFIRAFPVLNDGSDLDRLYRQNAERILLRRAVDPRPDHEAVGDPDADQRGALRRRLLHGDDGDPDHQRAGVLPPGPEARHRPGPLRDGRDREPADRHQHPAVRDLPLHRDADRPGLVRRHHPGRPPVPDPMIATLLLITFFPWLVLFLPRLFR
jgi:nitroreductase